MELRASKEKSCYLSILVVFLEIIDAENLHLRKLAIHEVKANIVYIWEKVQMEAQVLFQIFKPSNPKEIKMV